MEKDSELKEITELLQGGNSDQVTGDPVQLPFDSKYEVAKDTFSIEAMERKEKQKIIQNLLYITENTRNLKMLIITLVSEGLLSINDKQIIESSPEDSEKVYQLFTMLMKLPKYKELISILDETDNNHIANKLRNLRVLSYQCDNMQGTFLGFKDSTSTTQVNRKEDSINIYPQLDCLQRLSKITIKHQESLREAFGGKIHYKILDGHRKELILLGEQKNCTWSWSQPHPKPVTIVHLNGSSFLKIEFENSSKFSRSSKRVRVSLPDGTKLGFVEAKSKSDDFEIYSDDDNIQFIVKFKQKIFKPSEYAIYTSSDGKLVCKIYRSGITKTHFSVEIVDTISSTIKALVIGLVMCIMEGDAAAAGAAVVASVVSAC